MPPSEHCLGWAGLFLRLVCVLLLHCWRCHACTGWCLLSQAIGCYRSCSCWVTWPQTRPCLPPGPFYQLHCRRCCHLTSWQEPVAWAPAADAVHGVLRLLRCCPEGANAVDREGFTLLHRLALAGQPRCLELLLSAGGEELDLLLRTRSGANALQLAKQHRHEACVLLLEAATQQAAEARQAALLKVGCLLEVLLLPPDSAVHAGMWLEGGILGAAVWWPCCLGFAAAAPCVYVHFAALQSSRHAHFVFGFRAFSRSWRRWRRRAPRAPPARRARRRRCGRGQGCFSCLTLCDIEQRGCRAAACMSFRWPLVWGP